MSADAGVTEKVAEKVAEAAPQVMQQAATAQEPQVVFLWWLPLILALVLLFTIEFVRALPLKKETLRAKPFTCDACMTGWAGIALFLLQLWAFGSSTWVLALMHTWPSLGLCLLFLALRNYWKPTIPTES